MNCALRPRRSTFSVEMADDIGVTPEAAIIVRSGWSPLGVETYIKNDCITPWHAEAAGRLFLRLPTIQLQQLGCLDWWRVTSSSSVAKSDSCDGCPAWSTAADSLTDFRWPPPGPLLRTLLPDPPPPPLTLRPLLSSSAVMAVTGKSSPLFADVLKNRVLSGCSGSVLSPPSS